MRHRKRSSRASRPFKSGEGGSIYGISKSSTERAWIRVYGCLISASKRVFVRKRQFIGSVASHLFFYFEQYQLSLQSLLLVICVIIEARKHRNTRNLKASKRKVGVMIM